MRRLIVIPIVSLLLSSISHGNNSAPQEDATARPLMANQAIERELKGGETHSYRIVLTSGQFLNVVVEQRGVDVVLILVGPAGEKLRTVDSPNGTQGPEPLTWVADKAGTYRLDIRPLEDKANPGRYEVKVVELRNATSEDRNAIAADLAFTEGDQLRAKRTTESLQKAIEKYGEARALWRGLNNRAREADAFHFSGVAYFLLGQFQKALENYEQALALRENLGDREGQARTLNNIGLTSSSLGDKQKALEFYNRALVSERDIGDRAGQGVTLGNIATNYDAQGDKQKALEFYGKAAEQYRAIGAQGSEGVTLIDIGLIHKSLGNLQKAKDSYLQAVPLLKTSGNQKQLSQTLNRIGLIYGELKNLPQALDYYQQAQVISHALGERSDEATILNNIASTYDLSGEKKKALEFYDQGLTLYRTAGDRKREALTLSYIGAVYDSLNEAKKAIEIYGQALTIFRALGDRSSEAQTLNKIGLAYVTQSDQRTALEYYDQALLIFHTLEQRNMEAATLTNAGVAYLALNERQKGIDTLDQALLLARATGEKLVEAHVLTYLGVFYNLDNNKAKALEYYSQALPLHQSAGDRDGEALNLNTMAAIYNSMGDKQKALEFLNQTLAVVHASGNRVLEAITLNNMGALYYWLGEKDKALESMSKALPLFRAANLRSFEAYTLNGIGFIYHLQGDEHKAREHFNQGLELGRLIPDHLNEAFALMGIGTLDSEAGQNQKAMESLNQALTLYRANKYHFGETYTLGNLGKIYDATGDKLKALEFYHQALLLAREDNEGDLEGYILPYLMSLWRSLNKPGLAIWYGKQAVNAYQQIRSNIRDFDKGLQKGFLLSKEDTYRELAALLISEGRLPEAQQVIGLLKEEEYFGFVRREPGVSELLKRADLTPEEKAALERYSVVADRITAIGKELSALTARGVSRDDAQFQKLSSDLEAANSTFRVFLRELEDEFGTRVMEDVRQDEGLQSDLRQLGKGTVALYTLVGQEKYQVILTTPTIRVHREFKITGSDLNSLVLKFSQAVQNPNVDPKPLGQQLYKILVGPVEKDLEAEQAKTLVWSLDGTLRYVPIAALHDGRQYLAERYQNVIITLASRTRLNAPSSRAWPALGLGVSKGIVTKEGLQFSALPFVPDELHGIIREEKGSARSSGVVPGRVMLDEAFNLRAMQEALGQGRYPLVHIASHFSFSPGNNTKSFLVLGDGDQLTLDKIGKSPIPFFEGVQLLTLSACNTAVGDRANGSEVENFAVLAQLKGAQAVLATLWAVRDESTRDLMLRFYKSRVASPGITKAEALRQAQLSLLRGETNPTTKGRKNGSPVGNTDSTGRFSHPYYWAPFILIGNWR